MPKKVDILKAYKLTPKQYSLMAGAYGMLSSDLQDKFKQVTNDLAVNADDLSQNEARFISGMDLDMKRMGQKPFLTDKAKKKLQQIL